MVKLRLRRKGRKKAPFYDIVAVDVRNRRDGKYLERIGYVNPMPKPSIISINHERALYWLGVGAQPTDVVQSYLSNDGVLLRRHLGFKEKSTEEIEEAVVQHRAHANERYLKNVEKRAARKVRAAEAKAAEKSS